MRREALTASRHSLRGLGASHVSRAATAAALLLAATSPALSAQTAADVLRTALERYERRTEGVKSYAVTQNAMGYRTTTYFEKVEIEGHPVFRIVPGPGESAAADSSLRNPYALFPRILDRAVLRGRATVAGTEAWVVAVEDFEGLDVQAPGVSRREGRFEPRTGEFFIGTDGHLLRKIQLEGVLHRGGRSAPVALTAGLGDYRSVEGMHHPFRVDVRLEGLADLFSPAEQRRLEGLQRRMQQMSEQDREAMRKMLGPQLRQMQQILETGALEFTATVERLEVNPERPPGGG